MCDSCRLGYVLSGCLLLESMFVFDLFFLLFDVCMWFIPHFFFAEELFIFPRVIIAFYRKMIPYKSASYSKGFTKWQGSCSNWEILYIFHSLSQGLIYLSSYSLGRPHPQISGFFLFYLTTVYSGVGSILLQRIGLLGSSQRWLSMNSTSEDSSIRQQTNMWM